jgi:hypothetical protein
MVLTDDFGAYSVINLILAGILFLGALADLAIYALLKVKNQNGEGALRRLAVAVLATIGLLSILGSILPDRTIADSLTRLALGTLRGAGIVLVWMLLIYDLNRYMNERVRAGRG